MTDSPFDGPPDESGYRIGAVCRMTGLSQHVLRVWEKRYGAVQPQRSETDRRLYLESDINRLLMLKTLVDRGQAIGSIAGLDEEELERRVRQSAGALRISGAVEKPSLALFGATLLVARDDCASSETFAFAGHYDDISELAAEKPARRLDVAVVEWSSLQPDSVIELTRKANRLNVRHLVLVYDYAPRAVLRGLANDRVTALRSPLDQAALEAVVAWRFGLALGPADSPEESGLIPARQFSDRELAHLAMQSSAIACECPMHLAELITKLVHFEAYSAECESRSPEDAALHGYLHRTSSNARSMMERTLMRVVEMENLSRLPDS
jgi:MerR family transcriptional regulator, light-induced transcriptional regulator